MIEVEHEAAWLLLIGGLLKGGRLETEIVLLGYCARYGNAQIDVA